MIGPLGGDEGLRTRGFTLIEVVGALVIFSVGVIGIMRAGSGITTQLRYSGARSEIVVLANAQVDSIESSPFDSISAGTVEDTVTVQGWSYRRQVSITSVTPVLARIDISFERVDSAGPSYSVTSYTSDVW